MYSVAGTFFLDVAMFSLIAPKVLTNMYYRTSIGASLVEYALFVALIAFGLCSSAAVVWSKYRQHPQKKCLLSRSFNRRGD